MKTFILLFCTSVFSLSSGDIFSQDSKIEIEKDDVVTIDEIFDLLRTQTNYTFIYQEDLFKDTPKVQIKKGTIKTNELLKQTLSSVDFNFDFSTNNKIVITKVKQQSQISGLVTDGGELGGPLPGVTVLVKGTTNGTSTDFDGNYTLNNVASNAVLVFSYIGYKTQEVPVNNQKSINITLETDVSQLDEIVIIDYGYGKVKKADMTGATASIGSKELAKIPVTNVAEALSGRLAGVNITTADGEPGAEASIRIRGGGSINQANDPLIVVDGFIVGSLSDVPSSDIATINVLKDASATAVYGARGANGVIIVTTKSPVSGKVAVSYNNFFQFNAFPENRKLEVLDPYEFVLANYEYAAVRGGTVLERFQQFFGNYNDLELYKQRKATDWQDEILGNTRMSQYHNISVNGGTDITKMNLSVTHNDDEGLIQGSNYERTTVNFKLDQEISKKLNLSAGARITNSIKGGAGTAGVSNNSSSTLRIKNLIQTRPINGIADELDINSNGGNSGGDFEDFLSDFRDPYDLLEQDWREETKNQYVLNIGMTWKIFDNLNFKSTFNTSKEYKKTLRYYGPETSAASFEGGLPFGRKTINNTNSYRLVNTLNYKREWSDYKIDFLVGQEVSSQGGDQEYVQGTRYRTSITPEELFANMQIGQISSDNYETTNQIDFNRTSFFTRFDFQLLNKYIFTITGRGDKSSKFQGKNQLGIFPAIAFAWKMNEENFLKDSDLINELKFRITYGETGNDNITTGISQDLYTATSNDGPGFGNVPNTYYRTLKSGLLFNKDLKWETTSTSNIGLDFSLFNKRLYGSADYYNSITRDLLYFVEIPKSSGFENQWDNIGSTQNEGFDLGLTGYIIENKDITLSANFNIGVNKLRIRSLNEGISGLNLSSNWDSTLDNAQDYSFKVGGPIGDIVGYVTDGYYTTDDFESYDETTEEYILKEGVTQPLSSIYDAKPGLLKVKDLNGDGEIDSENDRQVIGNALPDFQGGFGFNMRYKNFDLSTFLNFQVGNDVYNVGKLEYNQLYRIKGGYGNMLTSMSSENRFTYIDIDGSYTGNAGEVITDLNQLAELNEGKNTWSHTSFSTTRIIQHSSNIEDGSFLRLNNITLGYSLPEKLTSKFGLSKFRVYASGRNLHVWTKYSGYDPEVSTAKNALTPGLDYSAYPRSRSYTFGINVTF
ncbi:SusC/RagA family TonB-linked outer membrane protein [Thalassobellus suaedae]|uniref:TonB-dependent receptor n=1 Tax=Thalassobellus suaedae TaxID=3074124 RepID=A0ABY9XU20_9FLAO|nr:TonB-dependent receptor [Flavobacteriaceae bacterium HL-DH14]